ncbi:hypothetical protein HELRODRAFT_160161 [Helobdella robusta]|uniref:Uncharacterized protein n=1 Tax=Helobdella robusta TaxID=6412 RepID=T1EPW9_HELRO|nr:hypothetical protein HELRODRAFT_160161 [Helobdella robusta]ESO06045.1 hypothetical protein HELRODRAFT_160161 [Helobdella robusta]
MYEVDEIEWNICLLHSLYLEDSSDDICLTAAHFALQYLWVACGTTIYVLEKKARSEISVYQKISLFSECEDINFNISSICSFGEQIWCLIENFIVEIDSETFDIICFFDCSLSNFGETITNFNLNDLLRSLSNSDTLFSLNSLKDELGLSGLGNKDQIIQSCNINKSTLELEKSAKIRRKRSLRLFRGKRKKPNSKVIKNYRIKSIECCNGILWAGSISGEMILINVTQNSSSKVEYGQVLNVMCNEDNAQDHSNEDFQLSHMLKMPIGSDSENESESTTGSCSLMTMMSYKKKKLPHKRVRLLIWNCLDTIALHSFTGHGLVMVILFQNLKESTTLNSICETMYHTSILTRPLRKKTRQL